MTFSRNFDIKEANNLDMKESSRSLSNVIKEVLEGANNYSEALHDLGGLVLSNLGEDNKGMSKLYQELVLGALRYKTTSEEVKETVEGAIPPVAGEIILERTPVITTLVVFPTKPVGRIEATREVPPSASLPEEVEALFEEKSEVGIEVFKLLWWDVSKATIYSRVKKMVGKTRIELEKNAQGRNKYQFSREQVERIYTLFEEEKKGGKTRSSSKEDPEPTDAELKEIEEKGLDWEGLG